MYHHIDIYYYHIIHFKYLQLDVNYSSIKLYEVNSCEHNVLGLIHFSVKITLIL